MGTACMETFMVIIKHKFEAELEPVEKCKKTFAQKPASNFAFFDTNTAFLKKKKQFFDLLALFTDFEGKSGWNGWKKNAKLFFQSVIELNFVTINGLGEPSC